MGEVLKMTAGRIDLDSMRKGINKRAGLNVAHDLSKDSPTKVTQWISTGSRWLDSITCRGKMAGIPVGKITEIAGLSSSGKSFMAALVAANAQKMGHVVIYFDAESALDDTFLKKAGCDVKKMLYVQAISVEMVLGEIETLMDENPDTQFLFVWDSIAATASEKDLEGDFNPQSSMAVKPRIFSKAFPKLTIPLANQQCTLVLINQLKTNITTNVAEAMTTPWIAPGGKAIEYFSSQRIWLTKRKAKAGYVNDEKGFRIGSEIKVKIEKSRFGTEGRTCTFKIIWGSDVGIQDEESWFTAIKLSGTNKMKQGGAWYTIKDKKGKDHKFQATKWLDRLKDPDFKEAVCAIMDEEIIQRFDSTQVEIDLKD
jgi:recombination protein RecA